MVDALKLGGLLLAVATSGVLILSGGDVAQWIVGLLVLTGTALILGDFDLLHPYTWFTPFFFLYSASVPILVWLDVKEDIGQLQATISMEWLALAAFLLVIGPQRRDLLVSDAPVPNVQVSAWIILVLSVATSILYLGHIWVNNLVTKYEIALSDSVLARLDPAFSVYALAFGLLMAISCQKGVIPWSLVLLTLGWNVLAFLICGERDLVFRVLWLSVFLVHGLYRPIPRWLLIVIAASAIALVPVLSDLKNALIRETAPTIGLEGIALRVLGDEFITGSENLQLFLTSMGAGPFYYGETLLWDLERASLPGFVYPSSVDPTSHFNQLFFPEVLEQGGGRGFTLVGEGYMNFGPLGVALWFVVLGLFVRYLYAKGSRNTTWLVVYVVSMPLVTIVIRADFSNLIAQFSKHILLPVLVIYLGQTVLGGALRTGRLVKEIQSNIPRHADI